MPSAIFQLLLSLIWPLGRRKWHSMDFWNFTIEIFLKVTQDRRYSQYYCQKLKIFLIFQHSNSEKDLKAISIASLHVLRLSLEKLTAIYGFWSQLSWTEVEVLPSLITYLNLRNLSGSIIKVKVFRAMKKNQVLVNYIECLK